MSYMRWLWKLLGLFHRNHSAPAARPELQIATDEDRWNRLVEDGWLERWHPRHGRREWLWARRVADQVQVFPGSEDRPRRSEGAHYTSTATWYTAYSIILTGRHRFRGLLLEV